MANLDNILIFVKVARFESISKAALSLGMPISTVSRRLSVLESGLGVSLVRRTTRRVTLTPQGREYFNECQEPLTLIQEAERVLTQAQKEPEGTLIITVPVILGQEPFLDFISGFLKEHARVRGPEELKLHDCVMLNAKHNETDWDLVSGRIKARVHVSGPISSRDFNSVRTFVFRGHGVGLLPSTYCDEALARGRLVRLLPK